MHGSAMPFTIRLHSLFMQFLMVSPSYFPAKIRDKFAYESALFFYKKKVAQILKFILPSGVFFDVESISVVLFCLRTF